VTRHYAGEGGLSDRIYERLRSLGFEERNLLSPKDTAALDQFHVGGLVALARDSRSCSVRRTDHTCWTWGRD
jgi:hypothetical protein